LGTAQSGWVGDVGRAVLQPVGEAGHHGGQIRCLPLEPRAGVRAELVVVIATAVDAGTWGQARAASVRLEADVCPSVGIGSVGLVTVSASCSALPPSAMTREPIDSIRVR
jgi:hypothetical protein